MVIFFVFFFVSVRILQRLTRQCILAYLEYWCRFSITYISFPFTCFIWCRLSTRKLDIWLVFTYSSFHLKRKDMHFPSRQKTAAKVVNSGHLYFLCLSWICCDGNVFSEERFKNTSLMQKLQDIIVMKHLKMKLVENRV